MRLGGWCASYYVATALFWGRQYGTNIHEYIFHINLGVNLFFLIQMEMIVTLVAARGVFREVDRIIYACTAYSTLDRTFQSWYQSRCRGILDWMLYDGPGDVGNPCKMQYGVVSLGLLLPTSIYRHNISTCCHHSSSKNQTRY